MNAGLIQKPMNPRSSKNRIGTIGLLALTALTVRAQLVFDLPEVELMPNAADQTVLLTYMNHGSPVAVAGVEASVQVADGGPGAGGTIVGPVIQGVDVVSGTIWEGAGLIVTEDITEPQLVSVSGDLNSGTVSIPTGSGIAFLSVRFDTTGFFPGDGPWDLKLFGTLNGDSQYLDEFGGLVTFDPSSNGQLRIVRIVPEPASYAAMVACALLGWVLVRRPTG